MDCENQEKTHSSTYIDLNTFPVNIILPNLLQDKTTKQNIIFATDVYGIDPKTEITMERLQQMGDDPIQPRCFKSRAEQADRTRKNAEVFTPVWICNRMNNSLDEEWFGRKDVFNAENGHDYIVSEGTIIFPEGKRWQKYVDSKRLEITCGEAPFLVSRYDAADGSPIEIKNRIGILDRKMRIVHENTETEADWLKWTYRAFQSVYGYEYQGDNLLIARINMLMSFAEYMADRLHREPTVRELKKIVNIICWNIWQMDGLTGTVPLLERKAEIQALTLFSGFGLDTSIEMEKIPCRIYDWREKASVPYNNIKKYG